MKYGSKRVEKQFCLNLKKANKGATVIMNNYNLSKHRQ